MLVHQRQQKTVGEYWSFGKIWERIRQKIKCLCFVTDCRLSCYLSVGITQPLTVNLKQSSQNGKLIPPSLVIYIQPKEIRGTEKRG